MERNSEGLFAISKAGHDKGNIYVIVREDNEYVYVADGVSKTLEKPKKKNKKHIQIIKKKTTVPQMRMPVISVHCLDYRHFLR